VVQSIHHRTPLKSVITS